MNACKVERHDYTLSKCLDISVCLGLTSFLAMLIRSLMFKRLGCEKVSWKLYERTSTCFSVGTILHIQTCLLNISLRFLSQLIYVSKWILQEVR